MAQTLAHQGDLYLSAGNDLEARRCYELALTQSARAERVGLEGSILANLAFLDADDGELARAEQRARQAVRCTRVAEDREREAIALDHLGYVLLEQGRNAEAAAVLAQALALVEQLGARRRVAVIGCMLGTAWLREGRHGEALQLAHRSESIVAELGDRRFVAYARALAGTIELATGRHLEAVADLGQAIETLEALGETHMLPVLLVCRAYSLGCLGRRDPCGRDLAAAERVAQPGRDDDTLRLWSALSRAALAEATADAHVPLPTHREALDHLAADLAGQAGTHQPGMALLEALRNRLTAREAAWQFAKDGSLFCAPGLPHVSLERRPTLARLLSGLVQRRLQQPGTPLSTQDLVAWTWPEERLVAGSGANRVRVALSTLRKLGLAPLLERHGGGYRLDPSVGLRTPGRGLASLAH